MFIPSILMLAPLVALVYYRAFYVPMARLPEQAAFYHHAIARGRTRPLHRRPDLVVAFVLAVWVTVHGMLAWRSLHWTLIMSYGAVLAFAFGISFTALKRLLLSGTFQLLLVTPLRPELIVRDVCSLAISSALPSFIIWSVALPCVFFMLLRRLTGADRLLWILFTLLILLFAPLAVSMAAGLGARLALDYHANPEGYLRRAVRFVIFKLLLPIIGIAALIVALVFGIRAQLYRIMPVWLFSLLVGTDLGLILVLSIQLAAAHVQRLFEWPLRPEGVPLTEEVLAAIAARPGGA